MSKYASKENLQYLWRKSKVYTDEKLSAQPGAAGYRNGYSIIIDNLEPGEYMLRAVTEEGSLLRLTQFVHNGVITQLTPGIPENCMHIEICNLTGEICGRVRVAPSVTVQPDFSQTDETHPTFIAGKTHWSDYHLILPETTLTHNEDMGAFIIQDIADVAENETYTVVFNGTEYSCTSCAMEDEGIKAVLLGNYPLMMQTGNTGEPFVFFVYPPEYAVELGFRAGLITVDGSVDNITLKIFKGSLKKLDNIFLDLSWLPVAEERELSKEYTVRVTGTTVYYAEGSGAWDIIKDAAEITVYWDGVKYNCTVSNTASDGIRAGFSGEGYPFTITFSTDKYCVRYADEGIHSVRLTAKAADRMPQEFMPRVLSGIVLKSSTAGSSKTFTLTVDDNGTITAKERL